MAKSKSMNPAQAFQTISVKEKKVKQSMIAIGFFASLVGIYVTLTINAFMTEHPSADIFKAFSRLGNCIKKDIFYFTGGLNGDGILAAAIVTFFIGAFTFIFYTVERLRVHHDTNTLKGSAEWADINEIVSRFAEFEGGDYKNAHYNAICSENFFMSLNMKKHYHALNTLILGTTGSGKSRYYLKPNLLQMNSSYVITDPSGGILKSNGEMLRRFGYNVRVFDLVAMANCNSYNPMKYCYKESDVKKLVQAFMKNTTPPGENKGNQDPFWDNAMNAFLCACISLLVNYGNKDEIMGGKQYNANFANLTELTRMANRKDKNASAADIKNNTANGSELNVIFERIRASLKEGEEKPYCLREWENFKIAPEKTSTTILMTAAVRLDAFNIQQVKDLTSQDTINLDTFGTGRDALFVIIPTNDRTYNFLVSFLYTQLFDLLYTRGEKMSLGSIDLKFPNGELIKHFPKEKVEKGIADEIADIKAATIRKVDVGGIKKGKKEIKKKTLFGTKKIMESVKIPDEYYEIVSRSGEVISCRPTEALAKKYIADLQTAKEKRGNGESVPYHVRFLLDEFANIGEIPEFKEKLATMRKYEISCTVICQDITQLKGMYPEDFETIDANCPQTIFLGGDGNTNNEYISKKLGTMTTKGQNNSVDSKRINSSYNIDTRELMKSDELGRIPFADEIIMIYGEQPVYDKKFDYPAHRNYKYTFDYAEDCGVEASMFDRNLPDYQVIVGVQNIIEVERPKLFPSITLFTPEKGQLLASDPHDLDENFASEIANANSSFDMNNMGASVYT